MAATWGAAWRSWSTTTPRSSVSPLVASQSMSSVEPTAATTDLACERLATLHLEHHAVFTGNDVEQALARAHLDAGVGSEPVQPRATSGPRPRSTGAPHLEDKRRQVPGP